MKTRHPASKMPQWEQDIAWAAAVIEDKQGTDPTLLEACNRLIKCARREETDLDEIENLHHEQAGADQ